MVQAGNLFVRSELRLSHAGAVVGAVEAHWGWHPRWWRQLAATEQRTTSNQLVYENHPTYTLPGSDGTRASLAVHQRLQEPLRAWDRAPLGQLQSFHASGSATDLGLGRNDKQHHHSCYYSSYGCLWLGIECLSDAFG